MEKVTYCEFLFMCEPKEVKMSKESAIKLYNLKVKGLEGYAFKDACFVGVKNDKGWILNNS